MLFLAIFAVQSIQGIETKPLRTFLTEIPILNSAWLNLACLVNVCLTAAFAEKLCIGNPKRNGLLL